MYTSDALNWRFSKMTKPAGIGHWHAHEGRHTAVSIMSSNGVPLQEISDTVGHKSTHVTETVYRHVIVPAIRGGATVMDAVFGDADDAGNRDGQPDSSQPVTEEEPMPDPGFTRPDLCSTGGASGQEKPARAARGGLSADGRTAVGDCPPAPLASGIDRAIRLSTAAAVLAVAG